MVCPGPEVIKLFSCSTQLSTTFRLFIKAKLLTNKEVYFILCSEINAYLKQIKIVFSQSERYEPVHEISNNVVCATSKASDQPAHTRSLIRAFASRLSV